MTGKELKLKIDLLGVTQRSLAEQMGVTPQTVSAILTAKDIRTSSLERIAQVTNKPMSYFYGETDNAQAVASGDGSVAVNGNNSGSVSVGVSSDVSVMRDKIAMLERIIEEKERVISDKERMIQLLMGRQ